MKRNDFKANQIFALIKETKSLQKGKDVFWCAVLAVKYFEIYLA